MLARPDGDVQILDQRPAGIVPEVHMGQLYRPGDLLGRQCICVRPIRVLFQFIQHLEQPSGAGQGVLQLGHHAGDLIKGLGILVCVAQKAGPLSHRNAPLDGEQRAHQGHSGIYHGVDKPGDRVGQAAVKDGLQTGRLKAAVDLVKAVQAVVLLLKGLDHLLPLDHLVDEGGLFPPHLALPPEVLLAFVGDKGRSHDAQRCDDHHHQGDGDVDVKHEAQSTHDGEHAAEQLGKAHQQSVGKHVHIRDDPADQVAGGMGVQIPQRERLDLLDGHVPQIPADTEGHAVVALVHSPLGQGGDRNGNGDDRHDSDQGGKIHPPRAQHHINGFSGENGNQQLRAHAGRGQRQTQGQKDPVGADAAQHPLQHLFCGGLCAGAGSLHAPSPPFLNWLS